MKQVQTTAYKAMGIPSLAVMLATLCLCSIAVLTLTAALADEKLTNKTVATVQRTLAGAGEAEEKLYQINILLGQYTAGTIGYQQLQQGLWTVAEAELAGSEGAEEYRIHFVGAINSSLQYGVEVAYTPQTGGVTVLQKRVVYIHDWQEGNRVEVFSPS